jgi:hypothetical protein
VGSRWAVVRDVPDRACECRRMDMGREERIMREWVTSNVAKSLKECSKILGILLINLRSVPENLVKEAFVSFYLVVSNWLWYTQQEHILYICIRLPLFPVKFFWGETDSPSPHINIYDDLMIKEIRYGKLPFV